VQELSSRFFSIELSIDKVAHGVKGRESRSFWGRQFPVRASGYPDLMKG
jgi:hypothetical protein